MTLNVPTHRSNRVSRRAIAKGAAWALPAMTVATTAPALATSLRKDPGINGWILITPQPRGFCGHTLEANSNPSSNTAVATPDGAPYGLYLYDVDEEATVTNARITYWIIGSQNASWTSLSGHSACWGSPTRGAPATKADGLVYTPYTWTYTCTINPANQIVGSDGVKRLWLGHFRVRASFNQPSQRCNDATYWVQRSITVDRDGAAGKYGPEELTFERRNGSRGTYGVGSQQRLLSDTDDEPAEVHEPAIV